MRAIVQLLRGVSIILWSGVCALLGFVVAFVSAEGSLDVARKLWAPWTLRLAGMTVERGPGAPVETKRPCVFVCNHQSMLDIPVVLSQMPFNLRFVAKMALAWVPILNLYMWRTKMVFVKRTDPASAYRSLERAADRIRDGVSVVVFAEGTRSKDGQVRSLKRGAFRLARRAGVPIVPLAIDGTRHVLPSGSIRVRPGPVRFVVGAPIPSASFTDDDAGVEALRAAVSARLVELHAHVAQPGPEVLSSGGP